MEPLLVEPVDRPEQPLSFEAAVDERLDDELRRTQEVVGQFILLLLDTQPFCVECVLLISGKDDTQPFALFPYRFVREACVGVRTLEHRGDSQVGCDPERPPRSERPYVDDVDLRCKLG